VYTRKNKYLHLHCIVMKDILAGVNSCIKDGIGIEFGMKWVNSLLKGSTGWSFSQYFWHGIIISKLNNGI